MFSVPRLVAQVTRGWARFPRVRGRTWPRGIHPLLIKRGPMGSRVQSCFGPRPISWWWAPRAAVRPSSWPIYSKTSHVIFDRCPDDSTIVMGPCNPCWRPCAMSTGSTCTRVYPIMPICTNGSDRKEASWSWTT